MFVIIAIITCFILMLLTIMKGSICFQDGYKPLLYEDLEKVEADVNNAIRYQFRTVLFL